MCRTWTERSIKAKKEKNSRACFILRMSHTILERNACAWINLKSAATEKKKWWMPTGPFTFYSLYCIRFQFGKNEFQISVQKPNKILPPCLNFRNFYCWTFLVSPLNRNFIYPRNHFHFTVVSLKSRALKFTRYYKLQVLNYKHY